MGTAIAVVGPGAIGSTVAALLHTARHQVLLCGRRPRESIEVRPDDREPIVVPGPVLTDPTDIDGAVDVVFFAVKDTQNGQAGGWLTRLCDERTVVCALQNGVEQVERVGPLCPASTVVPAVVWFSAEPQQEGWVRLRRSANCAARQRRRSTSSRSTARRGGDDRTRSRLHHRNLAQASGQRLAGLMVLTGRRSGMFRRYDVAALSRRYLAECLVVARAEGADLGDEVIDEITGMFGQVPEDMTTSMLTDREAHRLLECDIRGVIVRQAALHGPATPISDVVVPLPAAASDGPG